MSVESVKITISNSVGLAGRHKRYCRATLYQYMNNTLNKYDKATPAR